MPTPHRIALLVLGSLLALVSAAPQVAAYQPSPPAAPVTPLLVTATNAPLRVLGSDGIEHVEYDLIVTNVFSAPVTLTAVEVIAPDGSRLLRLADDALTDNTEPLFFAAADAAPLSPIPVGGVVAVVVDLILPPGAVPARVSHRLAYTLPADAPALSLLDSRVAAGPELAVDARPPLVIAPPLQGDGWLALDGCCLAGSAHRSPRLVADGTRWVKPETFAIDWMRFQDGRLWTGEGSRNEQYVAYGAEVVSAAKGTVVSTRDEMPDVPPRQALFAVQHPDEYIGNHVIVQILPDVWAVYAHLQPGSIAVRVGEEVATGQLLGRLGNSGNSTGPHLHFQLSDGPDLLTSTSLPFVFDRYTLAGTADLEGLRTALTVPSTPTVVRVEGLPHAETATYPLVLTVQDFP